MEGEIHSVVRGGYSSGCSVSALVIYSNVGFQSFVCKALAHDCFSFLSDSAGARNQLTFA